MVYEFTTCDDAAAWDAFVLSRPAYSLTHSWAWGELKGAFGWRPRRFWLRDGDRVVAAAQILGRPLPRLPLLGGELWYAPRGFLADYGDADALAALTAALRTEGARADAAFLKIEPMVDPTADAAALRALGYKPTAKAVQPRATIYIDLTQSEDALLTAMERRTRYNVNLSSRKGVTVRAGVAVDLLHTFYDLLQTTTERQHFLAHNLSYYEKMLDLFGDAGTLLVAEYKGEPLAASFVLAFGRYAYYANAASSSRHRDLKAPNQLVWEAIRWAKGRGYEVFDFWGIPQDAGPKNPLYGVYTFKKGFGGEEVRFGPAYDLPFRPFRYALLSAGLAAQSAWRNLRARGTIHDPMGN